MQHPKSPPAGAPESGIPAGQRRYYAEGPGLSGGDTSQGDDFELQAEDEAEHDHGPLSEPESTPGAVWVRRSIVVPHRERASKGWRRHLRRTKALTRTGRPGA